MNKTKGLTEEEIEVVTERYYKGEGVLFSKEQTMKKDLDKAKELLPDLDYDELVELLEALEDKLKERIYEDYQEEASMNNINYRKGKI